MFWMQVKCAARCLKATILVVALLVCTSGCGSKNVEIPENPVPAGPDKTLDSVPGKQLKPLKSPKHPP